MIAASATKITVETIGGMLNAFSNAEQAIIPTVTVSDIKNEDYSDINVGNSTQDKIFLLSFTEVKKYFNSNYARQCEATNKELASWVGYSGNGNMSWWLRTTGEVQDYAAVVNADGSINERGVPVNHGYGVRPAMWIDLNP